MPTRRSRRIALIAAMCTPRTSALCTGVAKESKTCRHAREKYDAPVLPPPGADAYDDMRDWELIMKQFGMLHGLSVLNVSYAGGATLHGAATRVDNSRDAWVGFKPDIRWDCNGCTAMVLMIDPDCGGRRPNAPQQLGWCGPALHSMWHDCTSGNLESCTARRPYLGPGVDKGTNRYGFVLLKQNAPLNVVSLPYLSRKPEGAAYYDLAKLFAANSLQPIAWNFMHVTGNGPPAWKKACPRHRIAVCRHEGVSQRGRGRG